MAQIGFQGLRVLVLETRRGKEISALIRNQGGEAVLAPALKEVPLESNRPALDFAAALMRGEFDLIIFLTGVGVRALLGIVEKQYDREAFLQALRRVNVAARGPKPLSALREIQVPVAAAASDPFTWRELMAAIESEPGVNLEGLRAALVEYGAPSPELLSALKARGAAVISVPVYQWALPDDLEPLREAVLAISEGRIDVVLFMNAAQADHLFKIAGEMGYEEKLAQALRSTVTLSIGPTTSGELHRLSIVPDFEPSHPKMGFLVNEAAQVAHQLVEQKRASAARQKSSG